MCGRDWSSDVCSSDLPLYSILSIPSLYSLYPLHLTSIAVASFLPPSLLSPPYPHPYFFVYLPSSLFYYPPFSNAVQTNSTAYYEMKKNNKEIYKIFKLGLHTRFKFVSSVPSG